MKSLLLDTNIFLRFILNDVPNQQKIAEKLLKQAKDRQLNLRVPQIIIFEIEFILNKYYFFSKNDIFGKLKSIIDASYLDIQDRDIFKTALSFYEDKNISLVDCFLRANADINGIEIFTFDQKLAKLS